MDLTPYLQSEPKSADEEPVLSVAINGSIALAMKGRFFLRCFCESFSEGLESAVLLQMKSPT